MSLETETVLDRRRLKRSTSLWRALAIFGLAVAIGVWAFSGEDGLSLSGSKHIARVTISGMITEDRDQLKMLKKLAESDRVAGVILSINSPGGTTSGGEALYDALRDIPRRSRLQRSSAQSRLPQLISRDWAPTTSLRAATRLPARSA